MDAGTRNLQQNLRDLRKADDRPVRNIHKQQAPDLLFQTVPPPGLPHGCDVPPMGPLRGLRLPTALHGRAGSQKDPELQGQVYSNSPVLASQTLVRRDSPTPHGRPSEPTRQAPPTVPETGNTLPPGHQGVAVSCLETVRLPYDREVFQRQLPRWQPTLEGERPQRLTIPACGSSNSGAGLDRYCLLRSL
ncbi:hypothetical protein BSL78_25779 [Apostichopus japonicus]|uniref:Uncharacterized protein n=1 Tax=Stichopus japonicus TaxID=307972 RepID=A0A2G8JNU9_STIJA|nr:hypothetical protein BSL78_25779 [Apostichopus japonicus]